MEINSEDREIFEKVTDLLSHLSSGRFPDNLMEVVTKATDLEDRLIRVFKGYIGADGHAPTFLPPWIGVYRMSLLVLVKNCLDAYLLSIVGNKEKLLRVVCNWIELPCENVLVFMSPLARYVCFALCVEFEEAYKLVEHVYGSRGDVLDADARFESVSLQAARQKWGNQDG